MRARLLPLAAATCAAVLVAGAASAHEGHNKPPAEKAKGGPVTVTEGGFYPMGDGAERAFGYAKLARHDDGTDVTVHMRGLRRHHAYPVHLHDGSCRAMGPHYRNDPNGPDRPPNELWPSSDPSDPSAGLVTDGEGYGTARAQAPWTARAEAASVKLHDHQTGEMIACADLH